MKTYLIFAILVLIQPFLNAENLNGWLMPSNLTLTVEEKNAKEKAELGKLLFFDKRVSLSDEISCATCHDPKLGWSDSRPKSIGHKGKKGRRNSPTIMNTAYLTSFFHDARANSLEEQALGPIEAEVEMNMPINKLIEKLNKIKGYRDLFSKVFGDEGITEESIVKAIASFERTIVSSNTPFHRWAKGDKNAISDEAKVGFEIFLNEGKCKSCHNGFNFTNERVANIGLGDKSDLGVYELSKNKIWYGTFKTPTLIDVEKSAPYFHDGSVETLYEAVTICGNGGRKGVKVKSPFFRDRGLTHEEVNFVVSFLHTLSTEPLDIEIPTTFPQ